MGARACPTVYPGPMASHLVPEGACRLLDRYALDVFSVLPTLSSVRSARRAGRLLVDGEKVSSSHRVAPGSVLTLVQLPTRKPFPMELVVHHVDDHVAVVYKPAGIRTKGYAFRTLERAVPYNLPTSPLEDGLEHPHCVHRLDMRVQGLVLVARTARADAALGWAFAERRVHKAYEAIVIGRLEGEGEVSEPVQERSAHTLWRALSHVRSLEAGWLTRVAVTPQTGRRHQIRRHLAHMGHPILGDDLYTEGLVLRGRGLYLAAVELGLKHPVEPGRINVRSEAPPRFEVEMKRAARRWAKWNSDA